MDKERGFIKVDENFKTNFENIYAVGDITGIQMLAHTAQTQSIQLIEHLILGKEININYKNIHTFLPNYSFLATSQEYYTNIPSINPYFSIASTCFLVE